MGKKSIQCDCSCRQVTKRKDSNYIYSNLGSYFTHVRQRDKTMCTVNETCNANPMQNKLVVGMTRVVGRQVPTFARWYNLRSNKFI